MHRQIKDVRPNMLHMLCLEDSISSGASRRKLLMHSIRLSANTVFMAVMRKSSILQTKIRRWRTFSRCSSAIPGNGDLKVVYSPAIGDLVEVADLLPELSDGEDSDLHSTCMTAMTAVTSAVPHSFPLNTRESSRLLHVS